MLSSVRWAAGQHLDHPRWPVRTTSPFGVEAVVVADGAAPGDVVQAVAEAVGVLVVVGLLETFGGDVHVVVSRRQVPGQGDVVVAGPEVVQHLLALGVGRVELGGDGLETGGRLAGDLQRGCTHRDDFGVERALVAQLADLLDDGAAGELRLGGDVNGVRVGVHAAW